MWDGWSVQAVGPSAEAVADSDSYPRAKSGGVPTENGASSPPSPWSHASCSTVRLLLKPSLQSVVRRPAEGCQLARTRHSTLVGGNPPPRDEAAGPGPGLGSPPDGRTLLAAARFESADTAADAGVKRRSSTHRADTKTVRCVPCSCLPDRHSVCSFRADEPSPDNYADRQDAILCVVRCGLGCGTEIRFLTSDQATLFPVPRGYLHQSAHQRSALPPTSKFRAVHNGQ